MEMNVERERGTGKPKKKWLNAFECDKMTASVCVKGVEDRVKWWFRTKVADSE